MKTRLLPDMPAMLPRSIRPIGLCLSVWLQAACQTIHPLIPHATPTKPVQTIPDYPTVEREVPSCSAIARKFHCDRRAILSMPGNYQVTSSLDETVVYQPGYIRNPSRHNSGFEIIVLVEDMGSRISLQHILQTENGTPVKRWRQDWIYESTGHWQYTGGQRFELRQRNHKDVPGSWTQLVYEAEEAPHYAASGHWEHNNNAVSIWISDTSLRPLPRRESASRNDIQLISTVHRYTITPQGWAHEADNLKLTRPKNSRSGTGDLPLVRETGFTEYRRIIGLDFSPAQTYWLETASFWQLVRTRWQAAFSEGGVIQLDYASNDNRLADSVLALASSYQRDHQDTIFETQLNHLFRRFVRTERLVSLK